MKFLMNKRKSPVIEPFYFLDKEERKQEFAHCSLDIGLFKFDLTMSRKITKRDGRPF